MTTAVATEISKLGLTVSKEWLDACLDFCQDQAHNLTGPALIKAVVEQWVDSDICVDGTQSGPQIRPTISPEVVKGPTLQGKFCLQVQKAIDIGQNSAYSQLQTALKIRDENSLVSADIDTQRPFTAAWEPKSKRMLRLTLTDGFKSVGALEFEPISQLQYPAPPGLKVELKGPILVRRGLLLLTPRNVKILGGRVAELEEKCSLVQQLTDILGRDNVDPLLADSRVARSRPVQNGVSGSGDAVFDDAEDELFNAIEDPSIDSANSRPGQSGGQCTQGPTNRPAFPKVPSLAPILPKASFNVAPTLPKTSKSQAVKKEQPQLTQKREPKAPRTPKAPKIPKAPKTPKAPKESKALKAPKPSTSKQPAKTQPKKLTASVWDDDDDDFPDDDSFLLAAAASEIESNLKTKKEIVSQKRVPKIPQKPVPVKKVNRDSISDRFPDDDDDELFCHAESWSAAETKPTTVKAEKQMSQHNFVSSQKKCKQEPQSQGIAELQDDDAFLALLDLPELATTTDIASQSVSNKLNNFVDTKAEVTIVKKPIETKVEVNNSFKPYNYLHYIDKKGDSVEIIKGCMVSFASKLRVVDARSWSVKVVVTDGIEMLITTLSSPLILETLGFYPADYSKMLAEQKKATMKDATSRLASRLLNYNGLFKLKFAKSASHPEIIELTPFNRGHLQQLKIRVNKNKST